LPSGLFFLCSWLLVRYASAPNWIYAPLIIVGVLIGLISMVKFIISAMSALERLEEQSKKARDEVQTAERKRDKLSRELDALRDESDPAQGSQTQNKD
jgi:FtsZ-binding cell division protein ZapB